MLLVIHNSFVNDWQENCGRRAALRKALLFFCQVLANVNSSVPTLPLCLP